MPLSPSAVNGSVLDIGNSFPFRLPPSIQQVINITRCSHLQSLRDPLDRHRSLRSQPHRHRHPCACPLWRVVPTISSRPPSWLAASPPPDEHDSASGKATAPPSRFCRTL